MSTGKPRLDRALALRRSWPIQQFGQSNDALTANGASACTDTCLQFLARLWTGKTYSQDQIRRIVGHTNHLTGLKYNEVAAFCRYAHLPYTVKLGLTPAEVLSYSNRGPVLFGEAYSWHPEWKGYLYQGRRADGKPNGYATPLGKAGKNQLSGFSGAHAAVLLGYVGDTRYVFEPNHGSTSRPEKPAYDVITGGQFRLAYNSYKAILGRTAYAVIPTKSL